MVQANIASEATSVEALY